MEGRNQWSYDSHENCVQLNDHWLEGGRKEEGSVLEGSMAAYLVISLNREQ